MSGRRFGAGGNLFEQIRNQAIGRVPKREAVDLVDEHMQPTAHRRQHAEARFRGAAQQLQKPKAIIDASETACALTG